MQKLKPFSIQKQLQDTVKISQKVFKGEPQSSLDRERQLRLGSWAPSKFLPRSIAALWSIFHAPLVQWYI